MNGRVLTLELFDSANSQFKHENRKSSKRLLQLTQLFFLLVYGSPNWMFLSFYRVIIHFMAC